jgi:mRNA interferase RelE/StbE
LICYIVLTSPGIWIGRWRGVAGFPGHDALTEDDRIAVENRLYRYAAYGAPDVKRLSGGEGFRLRIGPFRVILEEDARSVPTIDIGRPTTTAYRRGRTMAEIQTLRTAKGEEMVVPSRQDYDAFVVLASDAAEEGDDIAVYDARTFGGGPGVAGGTLTGGSVRPGAPTAPRGGRQGGKTRGRAGRAGQLAEAG